MLITVFNTINYLIGKPLPLYIVVGIIIMLYVWIIFTYLNTILNNYTLITSMIILLILDITCIYIIFSGKSSIDVTGPSIVNPGPTDVKGSSIINSGPVDFKGSSIINSGPVDFKGSKLKHAKKHKSKKNDVIVTNTEIVEKEKLKEKSIISLYENNAEQSLKTFK